MNLNTIKKKAIPVLKQYGIQKAAVFGSYARNEQNEKSDIDILIEYSPGTKKSLFLRLKLKNDLEEVLETSVDVVTAKALSPFIKDNILKEKRDIL
ncbi:MAG: uncharacterized protein PWQ96_1002 [Clostridia bacterium]|jgi:hypothetical protein|nr:polymerase beta domain protein region [Clostridiales bacterium]MDK2985360.1 uncharacterized protein [Clostridia bacterium]